MTAGAEPERRLAYLTRTEITQRARDAVAVLPIGATEQHGPHLITGTDHLVVDHIARRAADACSDRADVIVAPTIPYGFSAHHRQFGATVSISTPALLAFLDEACRSLLASGFTRVFILNGHGGNDELIRVVARQVGTDTGALVAAGSYWVIAWDRLRAAGIQDVGRLPGHAGAFETSLVAALFPSSVRPAPHRPSPVLPRDRYQPDVHIEDPVEWARGDGYSDDPSAARADVGHRAVNEIVAAVADAFTAFAGRLAGSRPSPPVPSD